MRQVIIEGNLIFIHEKSNKLVPLQWTNICRKISDVMTIHDRKKIFMFIENVNKYTKAIGFFISDSLSI